METTSKRLFFKLKMNTEEIVNFVAPWIDLSSSEYLIETTELTRYKAHLIDENYMKRVNDTYSYASKQKGDYKCIGIILHKLKLAETKLPISVYLYYDFENQVICSRKKTYFPLKYLTFDLDRDTDICEFIKNRIITINSSQDCWYNVGFYEGNNLFGIYLPLILIYKKNPTKPEESIQLEEITHLVIKRGLRISACFSNWIDSRDYDVKERLDTYCIKSTNNIKLMEL